MKLIVCSIGVLVVTGTIASVVAPVSSLAQPVGSLRLLDQPGLLLTPEPTDRLIQMDAQTRSRLQAMLTATQQRQLETALANNPGISQRTLIALNLSPMQQTELMKLLLFGAPHPADVLTPDQIEQVRRSLPFQP